MRLVALNYRSLGCGGRMLGGGGLLVWGGGTAKGAAFCIGDGQRWADALGLLITAW